MLVASRRKPLGLALLLLLFSDGVPGDSAETLVRVAATEKHMGTQFTILLYAPSESAGKRAIQEAFSRVEQLNTILSNYGSHTELNRLCRGAPQAAPVEVSADLWNVLETADRYAGWSDAAFDVTVGPVTQLWRRARKRGVLPSAAALEQALARVGYRQIELDRKNRRLRLLQAGVRIDLGGIGKGYAADAALLEIKRCGITRASVDAGGDFALGDPPPEQVGWKIGIASADPGGRPDCWLRLSNLAVATSGDLWQYVEIDGTRYSHLVDPRTGLGVTSSALATVIARDCTSADCLASTICILKPERGLKLVQQRTEGGARILTRGGGQVRTFQSPRFSQWMEDPLSGKAADGHRRTSAE